MDLRFNRRRCLLAGAVLLAVGPLTGLAQTEEAVQLTPVVISADRVPESAGTVGTDIYSVSGEDLLREQISSFADALSAVPSAPVFATGQTGAVASVFLRGANSDQTLFMVDGIRMSDENTDYGGFLGGARIFPGDTFEVALGPQSTLYGSDAAGGLVSLYSRKGTGAPTESISVEGGSFGTLDAVATSQGSAGEFAWNVAESGGTTDNQRINNVFKSDDFALRLDFAPGQYVDIGATVRGFVSQYGDPSDIFTDDPYAYETESNWLATLFFDIELTQYIRTHLTIGGQDREYDAFSPEPGEPTVEEVTTNRRGVIDWQNTIALTGFDRLVAGIDAETETTSDNGFGNVDDRQNLFALYAEDELDLLKSFNLTAGIRRDDYNTFGSATTGRLTGAWLLASGAIKLHASTGTGFDAPSFLDLYGHDVGYVGNPDLLPERSDGWDAGITFFAPGSQGGTVSATYFHSGFENLIVDNFDVYPATTENLDAAETHGVELTYKVTLAGLVHTNLSYTRLEAYDPLDGSELLRRPHYTANGDFHVEHGRHLTVGLGASWVGTRADVDAQTFETVYDPGYAVARIYASWKFNNSFSLKARVENLFDRQYEPVNGYPALGTGIFGGAEYRF